ncbi:hypothetical protein C5167_038508 [Papaver somniferum]|uniref:B box-type domain-containing protein n=1 Tax=Papaver somniferum TaxID=3469 RepID=A0A4Y7I9D5_PAPSO|nr:uncharacterized protein LOC113331943 [Papaver somniferum]RZC45553.1 hypothetical protein C5167_038508 [Papaver somniferum]
MEQLQPEPYSWIFSLLSEKFFNPCLLHEYYKKNEKNIFCIDCCTTICTHCLCFHTSHRLLQVRRYVYQDVIRLDDMEKLFDCSFVQSYSTNNAKVIFLNQRPQTRPFRTSSGSVCFSCNRSLQDVNRFCSLDCKVQYLVSSEEGCISRYFYDCDYLTLSDSNADSAKEIDYDDDDDDDQKSGQMTPTSVLDGGMLMINMMTSSSSSSNGNFGGFSTVRYSVTPDNVTRKKRIAMFVAGNVCYRNAPRSVCNKRKGVPFRSPFF